MNYLFAAIMNKASGSSLSTDVGGRIFFDDAPQGAAFPYVVFSVVSDTPNDTFSNYLDDILIQFSLFSASEGAAEITSLYTDLKALFDDAVLTITGYVHIWMIRENLTTMIEDITVSNAVQRVRHWEVDYSVMREK